MKSKSHTLLQITTIIVIALAAYASFKQVEGFQTPPPTPIPNSVTLDVLLSSIPNTYDATTAPSWLTGDRFDRASIIKRKINKTYPAFTTLMNSEFTKLRIVQYTDDQKIDVLYLVSSEYIPKATTLDEFKFSFAGFGSMEQTTMDYPVIPKWLIDLKAKYILVNKAGEEKSKTEPQPTGDALIKSQADMNKIIEDAFNKSKTIPDQRDDVTIDNVLTALMNYMNSYNTKPAAPAPAAPATSNLPLYIGAGVGGVAVLGTIGYFMFSASSSAAAPGESASTAGYS